jgi:outer membrane protein OmpA-like peptidoglycan-associated protein
MLLILFTIIGFSSFNGGSGTINLYSAKTLPKANLAFNLNISYAQHPYPIDPAIENYSKSHMIGISKLALAYGIIDYIEFYMGTTIYLKNEQRGGFDEPKDIYVFGDKGIFGGLKFYYPLIRGEDETFNWLFGSNIRIDFSPFHSSKDDSLTVNQNFEPFLKNRPNLSIDLLNDFEIYPLLIHLNGGYTFQGERYDIPIYTIPDTVYFLRAEREDLLRWGIGIEIAAGRNVRFLLETKGSHPKENVQDTTMVSFGIRFMTSPNVNFDFGVDYLLNDGIDFVPDWEYDILSSSYRSRIDDIGKWRFKIGFAARGSLIPERKREKPKEGIIAISVNDIDTDEPLKAIVNFRDSTLGVYETNEMGKLSISLKAGVYHMRISKDEYIPREAAVTVRPGSEVNINTVLRKKVEPKGTLTGTVSSFRERIPLKAVVEFLGTKIKAIESDSIKGVFKTELPTGTYNINVSSEGFLPKTFPLEINEGETTVINVQLVEKLEEKKKLVLRGITFATGKSTISPEGYSILDRVLEVLKANKNVKVEIGGHTDAVGSASYNQRLSEARAMSVRQYLIQQGIVPARLIARGYGESKPIAPNTTREGRAQNRRIEFTVISE